LVEGEDKESGRGRAKGRSTLDRDGKEEVNGEEEKRVREQKRESGRRGKRRGEIRKDHL